jgi:hypothetical protein
MKIMVWRFFKKISVCDDNFFGKTRVPPRHLLEMTTKNEQNEQKRGAQCLETDYALNHVYGI